MTITAPTLEVGAKLVKRVLGVTPQKGGEHPQMGTHNLLLRLGDSTFLEIIACNPSVKKPDRPRWFALDKIKKDTPAKIRTWVVKTKDIQTTLEQCSEDIGKIEPINRGDTHWLITIPKDGSIPFKGGAPALIQWKADSHPATKLVDHGFSLKKLQIHNPEAKKISRLLNSIDFSGNVEVVESTNPKIIAFIQTPNGIRELHA